MNRSTVDEYAYLFMSGAAIEFKINRCEDRHVGERLLVRSAKRITRELGTPIDSKNRKARPGRVYGEGGVRTCAALV